MMGSDDLGRGREALPPVVAPGEIHVWQIGLDRPVDQLCRLARMISADERARAERLRAGEVRDRFVAGRGMLRRVLGYYRGVDPGRLVFCYGPRGKPALEAEGRGPALSFNLAHSEGMAVLALAGDRRVGVDLEAIRPIGDLEQIVSRFFSMHERAAFCALPEAERPGAFFRGWTRKEAYLKAIGEGLSLPLDHFDVSLSPGETPALLAVSGRPGEAGRWTLHDLEIDPAYAAALAFEGPVARLRPFRAAPGWDDWRSRG